MKNILCYTLFILLFTWITAHSNIDVAQEVAERLQIIDNLDILVVPDKILTTTPKTKNDNKSNEKEQTDDNEQPNDNDQTIDLVEKYKIEEQRLFQEMHKKALTVAANETTNRVIECLSCYSEGISSSDSCYSGTTLRTIKCADAEQCLTELHPLYIRRSCMLPSRSNRTFVCKCPLCNDKPYDDPTYYMYQTMRDWKYDNKRLQQPLIGLNLLCKVCETTGTNHTADDICRSGNRSDYILCGHRQLCFINVNFHMDTVTRGCASPPAYNPIQILCNRSLCNTESYENPKKHTRDLIFKTIDPLQVHNYDARILKDYLNLLFFMNFVLIYFTNIY